MLLCRSAVCIFRNFKVGVNVLQPFCFMFGFFAAFGGVSVWFLVTFVLWACVWACKIFPVVSLISLPIPWTSLLFVMPANDSSSPSSYFLPAGEEVWISTLTCARFGRFAFVFSCFPSSLYPVILAPCLRAKQPGQIVRPCLPLCSSFIVFVCAPEEWDERWADNFPRWNQIYPRDIFAVWTFCNGWKV